MSRLLTTDWITSFLQYTKNFPAPFSMRKWAALSCVAGVLERKVWTYTHQRTYPALYILLVGGPGIGKTVPLVVVEKLLRNMKDHFTAPSNVSKASLIDFLNESEKKVVRPMDDPPVVTFNSANVVIKEMGTLIPSYDQDLMTFLTDAWDAEYIGDKKRLGNINIEIANPSLNMLMATTPSYLMNLMPEGAWDQGFISRVIMVHSAERLQRKFFQKNAMDHELFKKLEKDLVHIGKLYGEATWTPEAEELFELNYEKGFPPAPDHPKLLYYNQRRAVNIAKMCTAICASRSDDLRITKEDFQTAHSWIMEAEAEMVQIFRATSPTSKVMEEVYYFVWMRQQQSGKGVLEGLLVEFIAARMPTHQVMMLIDVLLKSGALVKESNIHGTRYTARSRMATE